MTDDPSKKLILARRARFMAATLAGVATAATLGGAVEACGGETESTDLSTDAGLDGSPQACLSVLVDAGGDAAPQPCLSPPSNVDAGEDADAAPQPCLKVAVDAGEDADAAPQPCLAPPLDGG